jgi:hypothetical protein
MPFHSDATNPPVLVRILGKGLPSPLASIGQKVNHAQPTSHPPLRRDRCVLLLEIMMADERTLEQLLTDFRVQMGLELISTHELLIERVDSSAVEPLIQMLSEIEEGSVQEDLYDLIIDLLCKIGDPRAISPIVKVLHRIDFKLAIALGVYGQLATPMLIDTLKSEHWQARKNAAYLLMYPRFRNEKVVPSLVEVALNNNEHFAIRAEAIFALQHIGDKSVIQPLRPLRNDPDEQVREATEKMLNAFQSRYSLVHIAKRLIHHSR